MTPEDRAAFTAALLAIEDPRLRITELLEWQSLIDELHMDALVEAWSGWPKCDAG